MKSWIISIACLALSSCFMMVAWYGHLKFKNAPITTVLFASWGIAFFEYCLQVPGNRIGHEVMSAGQLRIIAEFFGLAAFILFSVFYLKEPLNLNLVLAFGCVILAVYFAFLGPFS